MSFLWAVKNNQTELLSEHQKPFLWLVVGNESQRKNGLSNIDWCIGFFNVFVEKSACSFLILHTYFRKCTVQMSTIPRVFITMSTKICLSLSSILCLILVLQISTVIKHKYIILMHNRYQDNQIWVLKMYRTFMWTDILTQSTFNGIWLPNWLIIGLEDTKKGWKNSATSTGQESPKPYII